RGAGGGRRCRGGRRGAGGGRGHPDGRGRGGRRRARGRAGGRRRQGRGGARADEDVAVDRVELRQQVVTQGRLMTGVETGGTVASEEVCGGGSVFVRRRGVAAGLVEGLPLEQRVRRFVAALGD